MYFYLDLLTAAQSAPISEILFTVASLSNLPSFSIGTASVTQVAIQHGPPPGPADGLHFSMHALSAAPSMNLLRPSQHSDGVFSGHSQPGGRGG